MNTKEDILAQINKIYNPDQYRTLKDTDFGVNDLQSLADYYAQLGQVKQTRQVQGLSGRDQFVNAVMPEAQKWISGTNKISGQKNTGTLIEGATDDSVKKALGWAYDAIQQGVYSPSGFAEAVNQYSGGKLSSDNIAGLTKVGNQLNNFPKQRLLSEFSDVPKYEEYTQDTSADVNKYKDLLGQKQSEQDVLNQDQAIKDKYAEIYPQLKSNLSQEIEDAFIPQRQKMIAEEAALGRLKSPVSIPSISRVDTAMANAKASGLAGLAGQEASQQTDLAKTIDSILQARKDTANQVSQFGQTMGLQKDTLANQIAQFNAKLAQDRELGLLGLQSQKDVANIQKQPQQRDTLDYLNTALTGLIGVGNYYNQRSANNKPGGNITYNFGGLKTQ